jgi:hypothetical protein
MNRRSIPDRRVLRTATYPLQDSTGITIKADRRHQLERRLSIVKQRYLRPHIRILGGAEIAETSGEFNALPEEVERDLLTLVRLLKEKQEKQAVGLFEKLGHKVRIRRKTLTPK